MQYLQTYDILNILNFISHSYQAKFKVPLFLLFCKCQQLVLHSVQVRNLTTALTKTRLKMEPWTGFAWYQTVLVTQFQGKPAGELPQELHTFNNFKNLLRLKIYFSRVPWIICSESRDICNIQ